MTIGSLEGEARLLREQNAALSAEANALDEEISAMEVREGVKVIFCYI